MSTDRHDRDQYDDDLRAESKDQLAGTAYDVKPIHRKVDELPDDLLRKIPVLESGSPLRQGAVYLDLHNPEPGEFVARGDMEAGEGLVPKDLVDYESWNTLLRELKEQAEEER